METDYHDSYCAGIALFVKLWLLVALYSQAVCEIANIVEYTSNTT